MDMKRDYYEDVQLFTSGVVLFLYRDRGAIRVKATHTGNVVPKK